MDFTKIHQIPTVCRTVSDVKRENTKIILVFKRENTKISQISLCKIMTSALRNILRSQVLGRGGVEATPPQVLTAYRDELVPPARAPRAVRLRILDPAVIAHGMNFFWRRAHVLTGVRPAVACPLGATAKPRGRTSEGAPHAKVAQYRNLDVPVFLHALLMRRIWRER